VRWLNRGAIQSEREKGLRIIKDTLMSKGGGGKGLRRGGTRCNRSEGKKLLTYFNAKASEPLHVCEEGGATANSGRCEEHVEGGSRILLSKKGVSAPGGLSRLHW